MSKIMPKICRKPPAGRKPKISCGRRDYQRGEQLRQQLCHQVCPKCASSLQVLVVYSSSINSRQMYHQVCPKCAEPSSLPIQAASQVDIFEKVLMPHSTNRLVEDTVDIFEKGFNGTFSQRLVPGCQTRLGQGGQNWIKLNLILFKMSHNKGQLGHSSLLLLKHLKHRKYSKRNESVQKEVSNFILLHLVP